MQPKMFMHRLGRKSLWQIGAVLTLVAGVCASHAVSTNPKHLRVNADRAPFVYVEIYHEDWDHQLTYHDLIPRDTCKHSHVNMDWAYGDGGSRKVECDLTPWQAYPDGQPAVNHTECTTTWQEDFAWWPERSGNTVCSDDYDPTPYSYETLPPTLPFEFCSVADVAIPWDGSTYGHIYVRNADKTRLKLWTGGKRGLRRNSLFKLTGGAGEIKNKLWRPDMDPLLADWGDIPNEQVTIGDLGNLDSEGKLYEVLPDGETVYVTPKAPRQYYSFVVNYTKYKCNFTAYAFMPWPNYPNDINPPSYYPYVKEDRIAGHAWWKLTSNAPIEAINKFAKANASQWVNTEVGYGPEESMGVYEWMQAVQGSDAPSAPAVLPFENTHTADRHATFAIGFLGLIGGLNRTQDVHDNPGTYNLRYRNCVTETILTGDRAGVVLPDEWIPEFFGFKLFLFGNDEDE